MRGILILFGLLLLSHLGCTLNLAGKNVGSETTNGLAGIVKDGNNSAGRVEVALYPSDYNPSITATDSQFHQITETNSMGQFHFKNVPKGNYSLLVRDASNGKAVLKKNLVIDGRIPVMEVPELSLLKTGAIAVSLEKRTVSVGMFVFLPGTDRVVMLDSGDINRKSTLISDVPAADYTALRITALGQGLGENILGRAILVAPAETSLVGTWSGWKRQYKIKINTSATGANVTETISRFPLLVRLTQSNFDFTQTNSEGSDLRFSKLDGVTELSYEIEHWDSTNGLASVWVQVPTIFGNNDSQQICLYSGKRDANAQSAGFKTFDASNGFINVWHLHQNPTGSPPQFLDATTQGNHGFAVQPTATLSLIDAAIGKGISLNGKDQFLTTAKPYSAPANFSLSLWFNTSDTLGGRLLGFGTDQTLRSELGDRQVWMGDSGKINFGVRPSPWQDSLRHSIATIKSYNDGLWHFIHCGISAVGMQLHIDGELVASDPNTVVLVGYTGYWKIGFDRLTDWDDMPQREFFSGKMDEVRISSFIETAGWIKLSFENQKQGSNMIELINN